MDLNPGQGIGEQRFEKGGSYPAGTRLWSKGFLKIGYLACLHFVHHKFFRGRKLGYQSTPLCPPHIFRGGEEAELGLGGRPGPGGGGQLHQDGEEG